VFGASDDPVKQGLVASLARPGGNVTGYNFLLAEVGTKRLELLHATLTARYRIPAAYSTRDDVEAGGLMSYGTDNQEMYRQVGIYTGQILKGAKPAELPVLQSTKFEFLINLKTAKALGIEVPNSILLLADEVIE
jgi:putative ABC transport system substrate-binding protein